MGNVRRGQLYPLCVGAERVMQAQTIARMARKLGTDVVAHGCTAAGNDQVRFEVALRTLAPDLKVLAPVRDRAFRREEELAYLQRAQACRSRRAARSYSVNRGLWGVTIGGKETLTSAGSIPDEAWILTRERLRASRAPPRATCSASRRAARPRSTARRLAPVAIIEALEALAAPFGIGRGIHLGDTIIGTKGRVAFEAPAAEVLLSAHRELEKLVLTGRQQRIKELVAQPYGDLVHEGQLLDPVCRDIEALLVSSQAARHGRRAPRAADRQSVHRGRRVALLAHGRLQGRVRRGRGRVVGERCARLLAHRLAARGVLYARRRPRGHARRSRKPWSACAASSSTSSPR